MMFTGKDIRKVELKCDPAMRFEAPIVRIIDGHDRGPRG
jgi:hypothetical protein